MKNILLLVVFAIVSLIAVTGTVSVQSTSVAGDWDAAMNTPGGARTFKLVFKVDGEKLTGTVKRSSGDLPLSGTIKGSDIAFTYTVNYNGSDLTLSFTGKVAGDAMSGVVSFGGNAEDTWSAKRATSAEKPNTD